MLVRDPRRLGRLRVEVRIALGDLTELARPARPAPGAARRRHRDPPRRRDPRPAPRAGSRSSTASPPRACCAPPRRPASSASSSSRRSARPSSSAPASSAPRRSPSGRCSPPSSTTTVFAPSIVYDRDDPWVTIDAPPGAAARCSRSRARARPPTSRSGPRTSPAACSPTSDAAAAARDGSSSPAPRRSPTTQIARLIARSAGRDRPLVHVPLGLVRYGLAGLRRVVGDAAFATWEEAELMEVPMVVRARHRRRRGARGRARGRWARCSGGDRRLGRTG